MKNMSQSLILVEHNVDFNNFYDFLVNLEQIKNEQVKGKENV